MDENLKYSFNIDSCITEVLNALEKDVFIQHDKSIIPQGSFSLRNLESTEFQTVSKSFLI